MKRTLIALMLLMPGLSPAADGCGDLNRSGLIEPGDVAILKSQLGLLADQVPSCTDTKKLSWAWDGRYDVGDSAALPATFEVERNPINACWRARVRDGFGTWSPWSGSACETVSACGDLNQSGLIDFGDLALLRSQFGVPTSQVPGCTQLQILRWTWDGLFPSGEAVELPATFELERDPVTACWRERVRDNRGTWSDWSGEICDPDTDGIGDVDDNCANVANPDQRDTDGDGFGNRCDADLNNDGFTDFADVAIYNSLVVSQDEDADFDGNGLVDSADLAILTSLFFQAPGPSGTAP